MLPGIVDLHAETFARHVASGAGTRDALRDGLAAFDREAAAHGVTTAYLAQDWQCEGRTRGPERAEALMAAVEAHRPRSLTDLRVQLRTQAHLVADAQRLIAAVERYGVEYVVFNDRRGIDERMAQDRPAGRDGRGAPQAAPTSARATPAPGPRTLCRLTEAMEWMGVVLGSQDDPDVATRERFRMLGATVTELPSTGAVAEAAHAMQGRVVLAAPEVLCGPAQPGRVAACDLIAAGLCDALISEFHLPSLARAAWALVDRGILDLAGAWALISTRPASVLRMAGRGRLAAGQRADMVVVHARTRAIEATIAGGRLSHLSGEAARRFLSQPRIGLHLGDHRMAAE